MIADRIDKLDFGKISILLLVACIVFYAVVQAGDSIAEGSTKPIFLTAAVFAGIFIAGKIAHDWRTGVYYFLFWVLFEDFVRKYLGNNMAIYFAKDILVAVTLASFVVSRMREKRKPFKPPFRFALGAFVILGIVQVFNPLSPSLWYGVLGIKLYFYYIPLMFVGYALFQSESDLPKFFSFTAVLAGIAAWVGIMQSIIGLDFLNPHSGADIDELSHMVRHTHEGAVVLRAPSIFVSEGRFQSFMMIAFILCLGGAGYLLLRTRRGRMLVFPSLGLVAVGGMMTGSRGVMVYEIASAVLLSAAFLWGAPLGKAASYRLVKAIRRSFVFIAMAIILLTVVSPASIIPRITFYKESLLPTSEYFEAGDRTWDYPLANLKKALADPDWVIGHGIGTCSLGVQYVTRIMNVPRVDIGVEEGFGALILEMGILAPFLWLLWAGSLMAAALKVTLKLKGTWAFPIAISIVWFAFILLFPMMWGGLAQYQNYISNAYLWLFIGILFKLPDLVKESKERESRETSAPA